MSLINLKCPFHSFSLGFAAAVAVYYLGTSFGSKYVSGGKDNQDGEDVEGESLVSLQNLPDTVRASKYAREIAASVEVALQAGRAIAEAVDSQEKGVLNKGEGTIDFVTATDKANERLIFAELLRQFPHHEFIGEEDCADKGDGPSCIKNAEAVTFIVDPIDGTTNFCHSFPFSCVSIGMHHRGKAVAGIVYDPALNELYVAATGCGSFLRSGHNKAWRWKRLRVSSAKSIAESMFLTEIGYQRDQNKVTHILDVMKRLLLRGSHSIRIMGSGVLDLCMVASGRLDFIYSGVAGEGWKPWDHCAGSVLVTEAGGILRDVRGGEFDVFGDSIIAAASEQLMQEVVSVINEK